MEKHSIKIHIVYWRIEETKKNKTILKNAFKNATEKIHIINCIMCIMKIL